MSTLLDKAWDGAGEAFGIVNPFRVDNKKEALINFTGTNHPIPVVYGECEIPAIWVGFRQLSDRQWVGLAVFCHAPIERVDWVEVNGYRQDMSYYDWPFHGREDIDGLGVWYSIRHTGQSDDSYARMMKGDTTLSNNEFPPLEMELPDGKTEPRFFTGMVGGEFKFDVKKGLVSEVPQVVLKVKGRNMLFDPRVDAVPGEPEASGSYRFDLSPFKSGKTLSACTNPALIRADYLTNSYYGKGIPWSMINMDSLAAAASVCDTQVNDGEGQPIPLMQFAGLLDPEKKIDENLKLIDKHFRNHSPYHNGTFGFVIRDDYPTPDLIPQKWIIKYGENNFGDKSKRFNLCTVTYPEPEYDLEDNAVIWPALDSQTYSDYFAEDGEELKKEITLEGCRNRYQAIDYAESIVRESRLQKTTSLTLMWAAIKYQAGDVVDVPLKGIGTTRMRIIKVVRKPNHTITWDLREHSNDAYPWSTKTSIPLPAKDIQNPVNIAAPENVAFTEDITNEHTAGELTWDDIANPFITGYAVTIKNTDNGRFVFNVQVDEPKSDVPNLASGNYSISIRAVTSRVNGPESLIAIQITNPEIDNITGLQLEEGGTEFKGKDCAFTWAAPSNAVLVVDEYILEIQHPITGAVYFTDTTKNTHYTFTHAQNLLAGLHRTFKIKVYARGKQGQDNVNTGAAELVVNNPLPLFPTGVSVSSNQNAVKLKFNAITETDFKSVKVWVNLTSGFTPLDGQQNTTTRDNQIEIESLSANTPYYLVYGVLDDFNADTDVGVLSPEITVHTAPDVLSDAANAVAKADALTDLSSIDSLIAVIDGAQKSEQIIQGAAKIKHLTNIKDDQIIVIDQLTVEKDNQAGQITQLQQVDAESVIAIDQLKVEKDSQAGLITQLQQVDAQTASAITQVQTTQGNDKTELQSNIETVETAASNALSAQTGYCSIGTHSTKAACVAAGGTWKEDPLVTALMNAKLSIGGSEVTAGSVFQTLSDNGALKATAGLYVDVNGQIAGMFVGGNATSSDIVFQADSFKFKTSSATKTPFTINSDDLIEFDGEINIDNGRVVITDSDINLTYQRFKVGVNTEGLLSGGYMVGGIDLTTDGVALAANSKKSTTAVFTNSRSGGNGVAVFAKCNYLGTAFYAEGAEIALDVRSNHYAMKLKESNFTLFPNLWTPGGVHLGDWYLLGDKDGIWACNGTTDWKNLLTGATKAQGSALNKNTPSSGSGDAWN